MLTVVRRRLASLALAPVLAAACLDPNEDFDGPASTGTEGSTSAAASSTSEGGDSTSEGGGSSSETSASCMPDGFEDFEDPDAEATLPSLGSYTATLEELDARDLYNHFVDDVGISEFWLAADADVRTCVYVSCENDETQPPDCVEPATSSSIDSGVGCCGGSSVGLVFDCPAQMGAKMHLIIDQPSEACLSYGFEIATTMP